jgi:hypothetical protein
MTCSQGRCRLVAPRSSRASLSASNPRFTWTLFDAMPVYTRGDSRPKPAAAAARVDNRRCRMGGLPGRGAELVEDRRRCRLVAPRSSRASLSASNPRFTWTLFDAMPVRLLRASTIGGAGWGACPDAGPSWSKAAAAALLADESGAPRQLQQRRPCSEVDADASAEHAGIRRRRPVPVPTNVAAAAVTAIVTEPTQSRASDSEMACLRTSVQSPKSMPTPPLSTPAYDDDVPSPFIKKPFATGRQPTVQQL